MCWMCDRKTYLNEDYWAAQAGGLTAHFQGASKGLAYALAVDGVGDLKPPIVPQLLITTDNVPDAADTSGSTNPTIIVTPPGTTTPIVSTIDTIGDKDYYKVTLTAGVAYEFGMYSYNGGPNAAGLTDPYLELYASDGITLLVSADGGADTLYNEINSGFDVLLVYTPTTSGTFYIDARAFSNSPATTDGDSVGDYQLFVREQDLTDPNVYHPYYVPTEPLYAIDWGTQVNKVNQSVRNPDGNEGTRSVAGPDVDPTGNPPGTVPATNPNLVSGKNVITIYFAQAGDIFLSNDPTNPGLPPATITAVGVQQFEHDAVMTALGEFEKVADIIYVEVDTQAEADFIYTSYQGTPGPGVSLLGSMSPPDESDEGLAQFNSGDERWNARDLAQGGFSFVTLIHEFGHGHGLAHPHDNGGHSGIMNGVEEESPFNYTTGDYELNQGVFTMMSYEDGWQSSPYGNASTTAGYGYLGGLMAFDIAAIQDKYGVNENYNTADNIYTMKDVNAAGTYFYSIWDAGGTDKIVYAGARDTTIDLRSASLKYELGGGGWVSYAYGIFGGFTIANGVTIENATSGSGNDTLTGNAANNIMQSGAGNDLILLGAGGNDTAIAGDGNDAIYFGAQLTAADAAIGAAGNDVVAIQGNYNLTLGANNLVNVETLSLLTHTDARFGGNGASPFTYDITTVDANVFAGAMLIVNASTLLATEALTFDGSGEHDGGFFMYLGKGVDTLVGSDNADVFFFAQDGRFGASDAVDGGAGADIVVLRGNYDVTIGDGQLTNIETITLNSAADTRFAPGAPDFSYDVTTSDGNVGDGETLTVNGGRLGAAETMTFDGSAELNGHFRLFAGADDDSLKGGAGNDFLYGGLSGDYLNGGGGADTYQYKSAAESTGVNFDRIEGFDYRVDKIDLPGAVSGWTGDIGAGALRTASFDADLAAALDGALQGNSAVLFRPDSGDYVGRVFAVIDGNGDGAYQAGQDFVIEIVNPIVPVDPTTGYFV